jgi:hypothetical protein
MDPVCDTPTDLAKPASTRGPNYQKNKARRERKARGGSRSALAKRPRKRPAIPRLESKRAARVERDSSSLDWMKSDYKAKRHKFMLAYNTLEDLQPRIEELLERIRAVEPQFEVTHHARKTDVDGKDANPAGDSDVAGDGRGVGSPGVLELRPEVSGAPEGDGVQPSSLG